MKIKIALVASFFTLIAAPYAEATVCREQSQWLESMSAQQRDLALLKISSNTVHKFFEVITAPNAKPADELWGYKILSIGHYILAQSPYATSRTKSAMSKVDGIATGVINGTLEFKLFKTQLGDVGNEIGTMMQQAAVKNESFFEAHRAQFERLSNCVLLTSMHSARSNTK